MKKQQHIFIWQGGHRGGAEQVMAGIAAYLHERGHIVTVGFYRGEQQMESVFTQVTVPRLFPARLVAFNNLFAPLLLRRTMAQTDMVISHNIGFFGNAFEKLVYREPADLDRLYRSLPFRSKLLYLPVYAYTLLQLHRIRHIVSASRNADAFFARRGIGAVTKSTNFIDQPKTPVLRRYQDGAEPFRILFIGRDDPIKRLWLVKRAVASLVAKGYALHLDIFGVSGASDNLCTYHGWKDREEVFRYAKIHSHLLVNASRFEASPLSLLECLCAGIPCAVHEAACPPELEPYARLFIDEQGLERTIASCVDNYDAASLQAYEQAQEVSSRFARDAVLDAEFAVLFQSTSRIPEKTKGS